MTLEVSRVRCGGRPGPRWHEETKITRPTTTSAASNEPRVLAVGVARVTAVNPRGSCGRYQLHTEDAGTGWRMR